MDEFSICVVLGIDNLLLMYLCVVLGIDNLLLMYLCVVLGTEIYLFLMYFCVQAIFYDGF